MSAVAPRPDAAPVPVRGAQEGGPTVNTYVVMLVVVLLVGLAVLGGLYYFLSQDDRARRR